MKRTKMLVVLSMMMLVLLGVSAEAGIFRRFTRGRAEETEVKRIGVTIQSLENAYWAGVFGEVEKILRDKGYQYTILSCRENSAVQIQQIENFITNQVDLIMVHAADPHSIEDYLKKARDAGIKVMVWDDIVENSDVNWVLNNSELGYEIGLATADFVNKHYSTRNKAKIAIMNWPQLSILLERENGIISALQDKAPGKYEVVARQPALDAQRALSNMESILQAHPDVRVVASIGAGGDIGANQAFMTVYGGNVPDNVGVFSADATEQQLEAIINGEATRVTVGMEGSNRKTAEACVDLYVKLLEGEKFPERNVYRPLTPMDASNAAKFLADFR